MATSIFFTESKDFKLIKDRILHQEDNYLVYVYADTTNIRIPRELIMELPKYGNNLIWVDTAEMDVSDLSHHIVLTIGQLMNPEEEIDFYIVSKSSKLQKTIIFLRNEGIAAEMIAPAPEKVSTSKTEKAGRRGRPKKAQVQETAVVKTGKRGRPKKESVESIPVTETNDTPKKKRGRPGKAQTQPVEDDNPPVAAKSKRGRKAAAASGIIAEEVPAKAEKKTKGPKKTKKSKEVKPRKTRVDKEITADMIAEKLAKYEAADTDLSMVLTRLFSLKKVARPKFESKLITLIKDITLDDDISAENILGHLKEIKILESEAGGRISYKD